MQFISGISLLNKELRNQKFPYYVNALLYWRLLMCNIARHVRRSTKYEGDLVECFQFYHQIELVV